MGKQTLRRDQISNQLIKSAMAFKQAKDVIPGGVTANIKYFPPHPIVMEKGNGSKLVDVDGNEYIDYLLCYGALILGHGHPKVTEAVTKQMMTSGTVVYGTPHRLELEMARKLVRLFPAMDMVRFTNSGLEATLLAIRLAQAFTEKRKVAKFEGHYHGGYDQMLISVNPNPKKAGHPSNPRPVPDSKGISKYDLEHTVILPFNDLDATEEILREHKLELAAVILEPIQAGFIPAEQDFMIGLRKITEELGILLIFDEVKTGFRVNVGGVQSFYNIKPDLTALGKVLGGGFPIGAVGGKKEIMEMMAPDRGRDILTAGHISNEKDDILFHSGTYNGHPVVLAAGLATIEVLEEPGVMDELINKTNRLRKGLETLYQHYHIPMKTVGMGSIFNIVFVNDAVKNYRDLSKANMDLRKRIDYELLHLGIYTKPMNRYSISVPLSEEDIQYTWNAHETTIKIVKGM